MGPLPATHIIVAYVFNQLAPLQDQIAADGARIQALEDNVVSLHEQKATKFIAIPPLHLDDTTFPNRLSHGGGRACTG